MQFCDVLDPQHVEDSRQQYAHLLTIEVNIRAMIVFVHVVHTERYFIGVHH